LKILTNLFVFIIIVNPLLGQQNTHSDNTDNLLVYQDVMKYARTEVNYTSVDDNNRISEFIDNVLDLYLDRSYHISSTRLLFYVEKEAMNFQMNNLVNQSLSLFYIKNSFPGFSNKIITKIDSLYALNWSIEEYLLLGDNDKERDDFLSYYIEQDFDFLKSNVHKEITDFVIEQAIEITRETWDTQKKVITSSSIDYDLGKFIKPIEYTMGKPVTTTTTDFYVDLPENFIDGYNSDLENKSKKSVKKKKNKIDFNEELLQILQQNSDQLKNIQADLNRINVEGIDRNRKQNYLLQSQIDELKDQVAGLKTQMDTQTGGPINPDEPIINKNTNLYFEKNSFTIGYAEKIKLNKIFDTLIKMTGNSVIITGFADKSGDKNYNAYLSEKRAKAVQNYFLSKGIDKKRLIINFMGDSESDSINQADRKVVVDIISH